MRKEMNELSVFIRYGTRIGIGVGIGLVLQWSPTCTQSIISGR